MRLSVAKRLEERAGGVGLGWAAGLRAGCVRARIGSVSTASGVAGESWMMRCVLADCRRMEELRRGVSCKDKPRMKWGGWHWGGSWVG